jgi:DNA-binding beta-propeller fold protein YncE
LALASCVNKEEAPEYDPGKPVTLTDFYPDSGKIATKVLLNGENFGSDPEKIRVYFNQKRAGVVGSSGSMMYVVTPRMPGDECVVSVVIGNDSVVYDKTFKYSTSISVQTIAGNGEVGSRGGTLGETLIEAQYLAVDLEGNVFVTVGSANAGYGIFKINEAANKSEILLMGTTSEVPGLPNGLTCDENTGIILVTTEGAIERFITLDPRENFAPRVRNMRIVERNGYPYPTTGWKHSMAWCEADGMSYTHHYDGHIVKMDPVTYEAEIIGMTPAIGTWPGFANHPIDTEWMYMSVRSGSSAPGIFKFNIHDFAGTLQRIHAPGNGHRDGPIATAQFHTPWQIFFDPDGSLYVADAGNHCIRRITPDGKMVETILGIPGKSGWHDGTKEEALFNTPRGIGVTKDGTVYVADWGNRRLRKLVVE